MRRVVLAATLAMVPSITVAQPMYADRFVDAKSGYVVESREVGSWLKLTGKHPTTGESFAIKVSRLGHVSGVWNGQPVSFKLGEAREGTVELASSTAAAGAK